MKRRKFTIAAVYDTETTNLGTTAATARAIPILFIDNDIREKDLRNYTPDVDDKVHFYRHESEYLERINDYIQWGLLGDEVPIICAYNLMFDLQPLMESLSNLYDIQVNAQSSTNVYTLDLYETDTDHMLLRFWDTFHLDMRGLAKMGEVAGLAKATGSWDYSKIRTPDTPLTDDELFYAARDTQVIPMFLRFLLRTNDWMKQSDLGSKVLTKTSLVRQMARHEIAPIYMTKSDGKRITIDKMFVELCKQEKPKTYNSYGVRKACFRGGYTFTAAAFASTIQHNVVSVDVTSMHHTFINGRFIPDKFAYKNTEQMHIICTNILATPKSYVLENYHKPFDSAIHARILFKNIRLRKDSAFEKWGIALEPMSKFKRVSDNSTDASKAEGENAVMSAGWYDQQEGAVFAFGKLYSAPWVIVHVNEIELWCMSRVYEWDSFEVLYGEATFSFCRPPDYVTLQSNMLYKVKDDNKFIVNHYKEGQPYPYHLPDTLPESYSEGLKDGSLAWDDMNAYYISDSKGKFNGIYGTMAQDIYKPSYTCANGEIVVDGSTVVRPENWADSQPKTTRVLYTYGMRIVAGSRLHMVLAIERLYEKLGHSVRVLGGDTDSMKVSCDDSVIDNDIAEALQMFEDISKSAIDKTMERVRRAYPKLASTLRGIGGFEVENEGNHYRTHLELWNKCRVSIDKQSHSHITCAGLSRPHDQYHIERFIDDLVAAGYDEEEVLLKCVGYNVFASHEICHALEGHRPKVTDVWDRPVIDYLGSECDVLAHESICLYPAGRWLGETLKQANALTIDYLQRHYGRHIDTSLRHLRYSGNDALVLEETNQGLVTIMIGGSTWATR